MTNVGGDSQLATVGGRVLKIVMIVVLVAWLLVEVYPVVFLFFTSLKTDAEILKEPFSIPRRPNLVNYFYVWFGGRAGQPFVIFVRNSFMVTSGTLLLLLAVASLAGYALARGHFPGSAVVQEAFLLSLAVPAHVLLIPVFFLMQAFGLSNNLSGMILMYTTMGLPFTVLLTRAYFLSFPVELEEAALIDGCSRLGTFWRVVVPVSRNAMMSMAIVNVSWVWSELFFALVLLNRMEARTLPLAVLAYQPQMMTGDVILGPQFAVMAITVMPLVVFYFLFQRQITKGMTMGAFR